MLLLEGLDSFVTAQIVASIVASTTNSCSGSPIRNRARRQPWPLRWGPRRPAHLARHVARERRALNLVVVGLISFVTVWTGLKALYFDQPFGTIRDYVTILLWGFGAQVALVAIAKGLDRVVAPRRS